ESAVNRLGAERAELEMVLASGVLGRTNNLVRFLAFVCEKYFDGAIDEIKEYSIAVQVLGRPKDFDPQVDTIVRVTAHALRKRLEEYYRTAGSKNQGRICLPSGHYVPKFIHDSESASEKVDARLNGGHGSQSTDIAPTPENGIIGTPPENPSTSSTESASRDESQRRNGDQSRKEDKTRSGILKLAGIFLPLAGVLMFLA